MSRKKGNIVRHTAAELDAMKVAGKTRTDWTAAATKSVPDRSDPDDAMERIEWATTELPMPKRKEHTNLRIDADVLRSFAGKDVAIRPGSMPSFALMSIRSGATSRLTGLIPAAFTIVALFSL